MRILVVEDDRSVRETLGMVLESYHHDVDLIETPHRALEYLESIWPDILLLDLRLEGMSGEELYGKILERFGVTPPTVVLSAVQHGEERLCNMPGAKFLAKPYLLDELMALLDTLVEKRGAA